MHIKFIPMRWGRGDNYCYLLSDDTTKSTWIIDPAEVRDVVPELAKVIDTLKITAVVNTHHHYDHAGGNQGILKYLSSKGSEGLPVYAGKDSEQVTYTPKHKETLQLGSDIEITALHTPCHTVDSICWYAVDKKTKEKALFSGDTLFTAGCGRFFEGTGKQMDKILNDIFPNNVAKDTKIYPGHEYTKSDIKFAKTVLKENQALQRLDDDVKNREYTTGLYTLQDEFSFNPFMRLSDPKVLESTKTQGKSSAEIMDVLRTLKNNS